MSAFGQEKAEILFSEGGQLYGQKDFQGAIKCFKELAINYKSFKYHNQSVYNLAYTYHQIDSLKQATFWYEKIIASDVMDNERVGGRGIFEPYSNYKHNSTFNLGNIEYENKNYEKALDYYRQCLTKYPYYNDSATDLRIKKNTLTIYIVDCLNEMGKYEEALVTIVPESIDSFGSSNYESVVNSAITLINQNFDKKEIAIELEKAFETLKLNKKKYLFEFIWRDKIINLFPYKTNEYKTTKSFIAEIKKGEFWKQLTN